MKNYRQFARASVALVALATAHPLFAQEQAPAADDVANEAESTEIVVTARRREEKLQDVPIGQGGADGTWYLNVNHNNLDNATVEKTAGQNDDNHTSIKLFTIANGAIKKDYRGMPFVPIYA